MVLSHSLPFAVRFRRTCPGFSPGLQLRPATSQPARRGRIPSSCRMAASHHFSGAFERGSLLACPPRILHHRKIRQVGKSL